MTKSTNWFDVYLVKFKNVEACLENLNFINMNLWNVPPFMKKMGDNSAKKYPKQVVLNMLYFFKHHWFFFLYGFLGVCFIKMNYAMSAEFNVLYHHSINAEQGWEILLFLPSLHNYFNHFLLPFLAFDVIRNVFEFSSWWYLPPSKMNVDCICYTDFYTILL